MENSFRINCLAFAMSGRGVGILSVQAAFFNFDPQKAWGGASSFVFR